MARSGRPRKEINKQQFESLCALQCTLPEIASFFSCSEDTIGRWCQREYGTTFAVAFNKYSAQGKISLRRNQMKLSERSATMAIWLGKQMLGQEDKMTITTVDDKALDELEQLVIFDEDNETEGNKDPD